MNHQPFEEWLLSEDPLSPEEKQSLEVHLKNCEHCRELKSAWHGVNTLFMDIPDVKPEAGFVDRWSKRLEIEKQLDKVVRHRWQSIILLSLFMNVITGFIILLGTQFFTTFDTPLSWVMAGMYRLISIVALVNAIQNVSIMLFRTIFEVVPVGILALIGLGLIGSIATWIVSLTSLSMLPRRIKE